MKISFTGTGCSGKSTLLTKCREYYGDKFTYVTEVTRPIARKGLPINEDGNDDTQRAIIDAHIENNKLDDVIMDRCIVDGYVYTTWLFDQEQVTSDIYEYAWNTLNDILNDIDIIFYCTPVEMEDDGERSTNENFRREVDSMMRQLLFQDEFNQSFANKLIILEGDVATRFNDIKIAIEQHDHHTIR